VAEEVLKSRLANFLVPGGLWVGGKVVITPSGIRMIANAMNRALPGGALDVEVPIATIRKVTLEGGFITRIVSLETDNGYVYFRCFGAKAMAGLITKLYVAHALKRTG